MSVCSLAGGKCNHFSLQPPCLCACGVALEQHQARFYGPHENEPGSRTNIQLPRMGRTCDQNWCIRQDSK